MNRWLFIVSFTVLSSGVYGQLYTYFDTLTYAARMNSALDSIDISGAELPTTFDGGIGTNNWSALSANNLFLQYTQPQFTRESQLRPMAFSALPYLGFSYTFGGQTAQFLRVRYIHAFRNNTLLNIYYKRRSSKGILRNSGFTGNDVQAQFQHKGKRYSTRFSGSFVSNEVEHSGGLIVDTLVESFDLEFLGVRREDALSKVKIGRLDWTNYLNVLPDSVNAFGPLLHLHFSILNRVFTESGDLPSIYPQVNIDSIDTRDQYNLGSYANGLGLYYSNPKLYIDLRADYGYWKYQNLGVYTDSTELDLRSNLHARVGPIGIQNKLKFNLSGRFGEFYDAAAVSYSNSKLDASVNANYARMAPTVMQRTYFANSAAYKMTEPKLQSWFTLAGQVNSSFWAGKIKAGIHAQFVSIQNAFVFNGNSWTQDSIRANLFTAGVSAHVHLGIFNFQPRFAFGIDPEGYLPKGQVYARVFVKGKMFKAKKLEALAGIDFSYLGSFTTRAYLPEMDSYDWFKTTEEFRPTSNLHAFVSLGIYEFRFFVRYENMGSFWWDKANPEVQNYPMASRRFRIGLTWDFFN